MCHGIPLSDDIVNKQFSCRCIVGTGTQTCQNTHTPHQICWKLHCHDDCSSVAAMRGYASSLQSENLLKLQILTSVRTQATLDLYSYAKNICSSTRTVWNQILVRADSKKHAGENAPGNQQENQSTFKEEVWDPTTPKKPQNCTLSLEIPPWTSSIQCKLFSEKSKHNKETQKKNICSMGQFQHMM